MTQTLTWHDEYLRRVAVLLVPVHAAHGFRAEPKIEGEQWWDETYENSGWTRFEVQVSGTCPCGENVRAWVDGVEDVARFMRDLTAPVCPEGEPR